VEHPFGLNLTIYVKEKAMTMKGKKAKTNGIRLQKKPCVSKERYHHKIVQ